MGIKLDPSSPGTFIVSYVKRHPLTRQPVSLRRRGIISKSEARRVHAQLVIAVEDRLRASVIPTWERVLLDCLESCRNRGLTYKTIYSYETCLRAHTIPEWGARLIDSITTTEIRNLLHERVGQKGVAYQKYLLKAVNLVFQHAVESAHLINNPTPRLRFKVGEKVRLVLTEPQAAKFLKHARDYQSDWYPHWATALYTGLRSGELYALKWSRVNIENRTIVVAESWNSMNGYKSTKSGNDRVVEIAEALVPVFQDLKAQNPETDFVLPRSQRWDRGRQAHDLKMFLAGMGLPQIRFHDLRATWATLLLSKGVEPIKVMKMGGWKDMETMMIYSRMAGVDIKGALSGFELHKHDVRSATVLKIAPGSNS